MKNFSAVCLVLATTISFPALAAAQAQPEPPATSQPATIAPSEPSTDDIIVTAQRREQSLQKVPIAIVAVSAQTLQANGVTQVIDLPKIAPGITVTATRNGITPFLRGVGTQSGTSEQAVAIYVDNVYIAAPTASILAFNNIQRIEVLKGPQGTLFGRNATGGLVNVVTLDPQQTSLVKVSAGYANYNTFTGSIYATTGLTDTIAIDVAGYASRQGDGWGKNLVLGNDVNIARTYAVRSKIKGDFGSTKITLAADYSRSRSDFGNARQTQLGTLAIGGIGPIGGFYDANTNLPAGLQFTGRQYGFSLKAQHEFAANFSLTSTTAYRNNNVPSQTDADYTPINLVSGTFIGEPSKTVQQEFLLNGDLGKLQLTGGLFYLYYDRGMTLQIDSDVPPIRSWRTTDVRTNSYAAFAQGTYALTPSTNLTAGLRYTKEDESNFGIVRAGNSSGPITFDSRTRTDGQANSYSQAKLTWRFSLDQQISRNILLYASANRGFKTGTYNYSAPADTPTRPETIDAYEVGVKSDLFDRTVRFNAGAFYYNYRDIQVSALRPPVGGAPSVGTLDANAAAGHIKGLEADIAFHPHVAVGHFEITGSASYLDAKYKAFPNSSVFLPNATINGVALSGQPLCDRAAANMTFVGAPTGGATSCILDSSGKRMLKTPKFSSNLGVQYDYPVTEKLDAGFYMSWQHTGLFYWDTYQVFANPAYDVVSGEVRIGAHDEAWTGRLWARNITKSKYYTQVAPGTSGAGAVAGAPRTFGVTVDVKFGG